MSWVKGLSAGVSQGVDAYHKSYDKAQRRSYLDDKMRMAKAEHQFKLGQQKAFLSLMGDPGWSTARGDASLMEMMSRHGLVSPQYIQTILKLKDPRRIISATDAIALQQALRGNPQEQARALNYLRLRKTGMTPKGEADLYRQKQAAKAAHRKKGGGGGSGPTWEQKYKQRKYDQLMKEARQHRTWALGATTEALRGRYLRRADELELEARQLKHGFFGGSLGRTIKTSKGRSVTVR